MTNLDPQTTADFWDAYVTAAVADLVYGRLTAKVPPSSTLEPALRPAG